MRQRLNIETELRKAIASNSITVAYQPVVDLATRQMVGVEALARWNHPTLGEIPPGDFIPVAEDCGLISPLGEHVLRTACAEFAAGRAGVPGQPLESLAVNLSRGS